MDSAYRDYERRREGTRSHRAPARRGSKVALGAMERRRLAQLAACVVLFLVVFVGKGVFPERMAAVRDAITATISGNTDFRAAFASLGQSISAGEPVADTLGELWVDVFGGQEITVAPPLTGESARLSAEETAFLWQPVTAEVILQRDFDPLFPRVETVAPMPQPTAVPQPTTAPEPTAAPTPQPTATPDVVHVDYAGEALPANATMDKYTLDLGETVTPVLGWVSSAYGWREHPVDGEEKFHNGVDLAVEDGTDVLAFADGVVDFIGDSPDEYGLYTQVTHADGVVTFYCHCAELVVRQGQTVKAGDVIARSGETGNATGPHLHFEIKKDGVRLNPLYYIDTR